MVFAVCLQASKSPSQLVSLIEDLRIFLWVYESMILKCETKSATLGTFILTEPSESGSIQSCLLCDCLNCCAHCPCERFPCTFLCSNAKRESSQDERPTRTLCCKMLQVHPWHLVVSKFESCSVETVETHMSWGQRVI